MLDTALTLRGCKKIMYQKNLAMLALLVSLALGQEAQNLFRDPAGLYTAPLPTGWKAAPKEGYALLTDPEGGYGSTCWCWRAAIRMRPWPQAGGG